MAPGHVGFFSTRGHPSRSFRCGTFFVSHLAISRKSEEGSPSCAGSHLHNRRRQLPLRLLRHGIIMSFRCGRTAGSRVLADKSCEIDMVRLAPGAYQGAACPQKPQGRIADALEPTSRQASSIRCTQACTCTCDIVINRP